LHRKYVSFGSTAVHDGQLISVSKMKSSEKQKLMPHIGEFTLENHQPHTLHDHASYQNEKSATKRGNILTQLCVHYVFTADFQSNLHTNIVPCSVNVHPAIINVTCKIL
jgi:hypothetical protein